MCVCVPSQSYTSKGYKSIFLVERPRTAPTPGWPRPLPELFVVEAGLCTQTNSFFLAALSALGRDAAANTREMFVPENSAGTGSEQMQSRCGVNDFQSQLLPFPLLHVFVVGVAEHGEQEQQWDQQVRQVDGE